MFTYIMSARMSSYLYTHPYTTMLFPKCLPTNSDHGAAVAGAAAVLASGLASNATDALVQVREPQARNPSLSFSVCLSVCLSLCVWGCVCVCVFRSLLPVASLLLCVFCLSW